LEIVRDRNRSRLTISQLNRRSETPWNIHYGTGQLVRC